MLGFSNTAATEHTERQHINKSFACRPIYPTKHIPFSHRLRPSSQHE